MPAVVPGIEDLFVLPLKFAPLHTPPRRADLAITPDPGSLLSPGMALQLLECRHHLHRIAITIRRVELDRLPQHFDEFRTYFGGQSFVTDHWPGKRPLGQLARQQPVEHQPQREHVGLEFRSAHGLFRRNVIDRTGAGRFQGAQADLRESEVAELQLVTRKQDEILGLDVAMDDLVLVRMREGGDGLARQVQRPRRRDAALDTIRERLFAEFHRDDEMIIDVAGIEYRQDVRVLQFRRNLDLVQEFLVPRVSVGPGYFQRNALLLDRIVCTVHVGERTGGDTAQDPVFTDFLSSS